MKLSTRLALGTAVGVVAVFCIVIVAFVREMAFYERYHRWTGIIVSVVCGGALAFGLAQRRREQSVSRPAAGETAEEGAPEERSPFDLRYFGLLGTIMGLVTIFILPLERKPIVVRAAAPPVVPQVKTNPPAVVETNPPPVVEPPKPVIFPKIRVQGIFFRPDRPSVLINRQTCFVGDVVEGAKVLAISQTSVVLELSGETKVFHLERQ